MRRISLAETIAKFDAGDTEEARVVLVHLRDKLLRDLAAEDPACRAAPCPECGPHGNRGRVCLLLTWADCTTCRLAPAVELES